MTFSNKKTYFIVALSICLLVFTNIAKAQRVVFLFGHALYANPVDKNFDKGYRYGLGAETGAGVGWKSTFLVGTIGYTSFSSEKGNETGNVTVAPFKAGLRQYILGKIVYIHGDVGIARIKNKMMTSRQSKFSGDFGVGVKFAGLEAQLDYDGFARNNPFGYASWIGIKAGFTIGL